MHLVFNGWFWNQAHTGSGQYIRNLLHYLRKVDSQVEMTLVLPAEQGEPDKLPANVKVLRAAKSRFPQKLSKVWFEQVDFPRLAKQSGADIAHVPYWGSPLSCKLPLVVSVLDVIPLLYPAYAEGLFNRLYISLVSAAAQVADHIITISYTSQLDIENHLRIPPRKISVTYLAQDERFNPRMGAERDAEVRKKYNLPEHFVLGGFGFDPRKQVNELLLAYTYVGEAEGNNYPLVLAGREPDWTNPFFPNLREYIKRLNIEDYVRWIGYVDEADKPSLYRLADIFVYPSEYEGFGLPPLEAMASGTPVVAWDSVVSDEILEGGAYLVDDARRMAGAIIALLLQTPLRDTMVNEGLAQATKYNWRKTAKETLAVYEKMLKPK